MLKIKNFHIVTIGNVGVVGLIGKFNEGWLELILDALILC